MTKLSVLSIGAGAIGTYIGGSLALHGHKVTFVERPQVADELRSRGLSITKDEGGKMKDEGERTVILHPSIASSMEDALALGPFDVALFALKSFDTQSFLQSLSAIRYPLPTLLCLSNGVENESTLTRELGQDSVIAGTVTSSIARRAAGDVVLERLRGVGVAAGHPLSERLVAALDESGLNAQLFPRSAEMKYSKMLTNLLANATSAILDMSPAEIFAHPSLYRLEIVQLREAMAVMRAQGIRAVDLPGTPVRLLAFAVCCLPLAISRPLLGKAVGGGRGGKMPSFHIDLHSGRGKSEVDYLNGAVVRAGERFGIPTPVNQLLTKTLLGLTRGEIPLEEFAQQPKKLVSKYQ